MYRRFLTLIAVLLLVFGYACSKDNSVTTDASTANGAVSVSITDAPAHGFDHVWITVVDLWFHQSEDAGPLDAGWIKFPLASPVTIDLLDVSNGNISAPVWDGIELPVGDYRQIRILLAGAEAPLASSAADAGLTYNNQVDVTGDDTGYPFRIPDARHGIRLTGEFTVRENGKLKLAVDFDAGNDVIEITHDGKTEYILKPRLAYFDLENAGAIVGQIDSDAAANNFLGRFVFKAEQVNSEGIAHIVRRATFANQEGRFVLYPLAPGTYELVMRGLNYETVIVKDIPVVSGTTPTVNPTVVPTITMTPSQVPDYPVSASIASPTGAWTAFLQTLPGDGEAPYEIRFRHFDPLFGRFANFLLSAGPLRVGTYDPSNITLTTVAPVEGNGGYKAAAAAPMYIPSPFVTITSQNNSVTFDALNVKSPATARSISGAVVIPEDMANKLDKGIVFAVHGGMIVNAVNADSLMPTGGQYAIPNLPGGTQDHPLPGAVYGVEAISLSSASPSTKARASAGPADLSVGDATGIDLEMTMLP